MPQVFFADARSRQRSLLEETERLFDRAGFSNFLGRDALVALKVHFGERGNTAFVSPLFARRVVDRIKGAGAKPFLVDTNTLYSGMRKNAVDHLGTAIENGFDFAVVGAPLVVGDGLTGKDHVSVPLSLKHFAEARVASALYHADALIALSHVKGHELTGFGGALKNIGMGAGCRGAKQAMHSDVLPVVTVETCTGCGKCIEWCPRDAISLAEMSKGASSKIRSAAVIDEEVCIGCGECTVTCPSGAIAVSWKGESDTVQEKLVEYAYAVSKGKAGRLGFLNFILNVSPDCDCLRWSDAAIVPDIGILASTDPVAIDKASVDLINAAPGIGGTRLTDPQAQDKVKSLTGIDWTLQLDYAEQLGLGKQDYRLIRVG